MSVERWVYIVRMRLRSLVRGGRLDAEVDEELQSHLARLIERNVTAGMTPQASREAALRAMGGLTQRREECRDMRRVNVIADAVADLRYALRTVRKSPGFAAVAVISLALGIGANTAVFCVVNSLVLQPLPVADPDRLVFVQTAKTGYPTQSYPNYIDIRDRNQAFEGLIGYRIAPMSVDTGSGASRLWGYLATGNYFDVLGIHAVAGRLFHADDDRNPGASPFAVLSYDCWQTRFAGDMTVVGTTIRINRQPYTVLGVAPRGFRGTELFYKPEIWVPMMMQAQIEIGNPWLDRRGTFNTWVAGRLKSGVSLDQAESELNAIAADLGRAYPTINQDLTMRLAKPGLLGDSLGGPVRAFTVGVLLLAGLVLLAACANLATLLLVRGADRQRELAVRMSLGAGRARLVRQLLTESLLLSISGGVAGWLIGTLVTRLLSAWRAPLDIPIQFEIEPDLRVLLFSFAVSLAAGLVFGLVPARQASGTEPSNMLKGHTKGLFASRRWAFRDLLVVAQVALGFVLVSACVLSLRGLQQALSMPLGFDPRGVAVVGFELGLGGYGDAEGRIFQRRALEAVAVLPGVRAAAYSNSFPLSVDQSTSTIYPVDQPDLRPAEVQRAIYYQISPGYFQAMGTRLIAGRDFHPRDDEDSPAAAIVNETFARQILRVSAADAVGRRIRYGRGGQPVEVVGVVEDGKYQTLGETPRSVVFRAMLQSYNSTTMLIVRSDLAPEQMAGQMRDTVAALDSQLSVYGAGSLREVLGFAFFPSRAAAISLSAFGLLAIILAATGIHGLVAYAVSRRAREIGIRVAIGATRPEVARLVLSRTLALVLVGASAGLVLTMAIRPLLASVVYQASATDPVVVTAVVALMAGVAAVSCWSPMRRALGIDPVVALRLE
jgi:predicted permease